MEIHKAVMSGGNGRSGVDKDSQRLAHQRLAVRLRQRERNDRSQRKAVSRKYLGGISNENTEYVRKS